MTIGYAFWLSDINQQTLKLITLVNDMVLVPLSPNGLQFDHFILIALIFLYIGTSQYKVGWTVDLCIVHASSPDGSCFRGRVIIGNLLS
jgi:hypothetical protein